MITADNEEYE